MAEYRFCSSQPQMMERRNLLQKKFSLKSFGLTSDLTLLPPYWEDTNCLGGLHFNVAGLTDAPLQPASMVFVGAGVIEEKPCEAKCVSRRRPSISGAERRFNSLTIYTLFPLDRP